MNKISGLNRIRKIFEDRSFKKLGVYFTAGYPNFESTLAVAKALEAAGADFIEIGIPFSDSLVDGPTIQESNGVALANGMSLVLLFEQLKTLRSNVQIPVILMGGLNPILQFGIETFLAKCSQVGVDGVIVPELPPLEYARKYRLLFEQYQIANVMLIAPNSSVERVREIDQLCSGFIYVVSSTATTGEVFSADSPGADYLEKLTRLNLQNPLMVGFGIRDSQSFAAATQHATGGIVGSAMIRCLAKNGENTQKITEFVHSLRD